MKTLSLALALLTLFMTSGAQAETQKVTVLELFTSQGCSSCPPADELLRQVSREDPTLLPLSFHVDYWNYLGWKDPFSAPVYTERQKNYAQMLGERGVYTPELVVDGTQSMVGSQELKVRQSIAQAKAEISGVHINISPTNGNQLVVLVNAAGISNPETIEILEVHYDLLANTAVASGENGGRKLNNINNVTMLRTLGVLQNENTSYSIPKPENPAEGIAIIAQRKNQGAILNAASYVIPTS